MLEGEDEKGEREDRTVRSLNKPRRDSQKKEKGEGEDLKSVLLRLCFMKEKLVERK